MPKQPKEKPSQPKIKILGKKIPKETSEKTKEIGGQQGLEPTRYGDWEKGGRCTDF